MPTYEFHCADCGKTFEMHETVAEHDATMPKCAQCGSDKVTKVVSAFFAKTSKKS